MKIYDEMREKAGREHGCKEIEILRYSEVYPNCFMLFFKVRYDALTLSEGKTMICIRWLLRTPEGYTGGIVSTEFEAN